MIELKRCVHVEDEAPGILVEKSHEIDGRDAEDERVGVGSIAEKGKTACVTVEADRDRIMIVKGWHEKESLRKIVKRLDEVRVAHMGAAIVGDTVLGSGEHWSR